MDEPCKKQESRRKGMMRWKEKKSSRSSGNLDGEEGPQPTVSTAKAARPTPKGHSRSNSGSLSGRSGIVNFAVPPLQLDMPTKKVSSTGKKLRSHKGNAGFKSRCTDQERWHQYLVDEGNFREPTFACPFAFVGREPKEAPTPAPAPEPTAETPTSADTGAATPPAPATDAAKLPPLMGVPTLDPPTDWVVDGEADGSKSPERAPAAPSPKGSPKKSKKEYIKRQPSLLREMCLYAPRTLAMLSDNIAVVNNVVQYQSLEQFGVKKFNPAEMTEWETALYDSVERHFLEKDKGRSLKNKVRDKSLGVITSAGTPRSRSRSRASSDAAEKRPPKATTPQKGGVSTKEIQYGGLRTSINPLLLLDGQERSRSITHKARPRMKRSSTALERPLDLRMSGGLKDAESTSSDNLCGLAGKAASAPPSPRAEEEDPPFLAPPPARSLGTEKKERRSIIHMISGSRSPRRAMEDSDSQHALPQRSSSAKSHTPVAIVSPRNLTSSSKLESLLGCSAQELPQHFIPAGAGQSLSSSGGLSSAAETVRAEEDEAAVAKSISPLRLFSPRKKGKKVLGNSAGSDEASSPVTTPKGEQGKKKWPGYFQSLKMQLKTPRGTKVKEDEEAQAFPRKRKSRTPKAKKPKDVVIQRVDSAGASPPGLNGSLPSSPSRDSEPDSPPSVSPLASRHHSASFETAQQALGTGMVDALVDTHVRPSASHRLSLPVRRTQSRGGSSKSDTEAGLFRPGGVRFDLEELNPPSDQDSD